WQRAALVNDAGLSDVAAAPVGVGDVVEVAERIGVAERPVLGETLDEVAALHVVDHHVVAVVGAGEQVAVGVPLQAEGVAAALAEDLEAVGVGVVAPGGLLED